MFSRKICTPVLVLGLSLGALPELHALPPQGARGEVRIQQEISSRIFQEIMELWHDFMESQNGTGTDEGPGLCPNGRPRGNQGSGGNGTGTGSGSGSGSGNGNGIW